MHVSIIHVFHSQNGELKLKKQCKSPVLAVATFFTSLLRDKKKTTIYPSLSTQTPNPVLG